MFESRVNMSINKKLINIIIRTQTTLKTWLSIRKTAKLTEMTRSLVSSFFSSSYASALLAHKMQHVPNDMGEPSSRLLLYETSFSDMPLPLLQEEGPIFFGSIRPPYPDF